MHSHSHTTQASSEELKALFERSIKDTKVYQEAFEEGKQEAKQEAKQNMAIKLTPRLLQMGLTLEQIGTVFDMNADEIQKLINASQVVID